jgi:hypothetical protein
VKAIQPIQPNVSYIYYIFQPCCGGSAINFQPAVTLLTYTLPHQLLYDSGGIYGDQFGLETGFCYTVSQGVTNDLAFYSSLPTIVNAWMSYTAIGFNDCSPLFGECAQCPDCYLLISCDGSVPSFTTSFDLSAYVGTSVILSSSDFPATCFQVLLNPGTAPCGPSLPLTYIDDCICDCVCYSVIGTAKNCYYIDCDGNLTSTGQLVGTLVEFCSQTYPIIQGEAFGTFSEVTNNGLCVNGECPVLCYVLEDCDNILPDIYTTKVSLGIYAIIGATVIIDGYPNTCWTVTDTVECDCAIDVTVFQYFLDCPTCKGISKYKLTNCDNPGTIVYTTTDLSAYVGQVIIRLDCPGCWIVEEVDKIPSDVVITVDASYIDCIECARTYYLLEDCSGLLPDAITYTDLSAYVGSVIKLEYCPETCWSVSITLDATNAGIVVFTDIEYTDCDTCLDTLPCICTTVRNDDTPNVSNTYIYLDCDHNVQNFTLAFGETSEKFCMVAWQFYHPATDYIETFGACALDTLVWTCPAPIYPRRSITPGYNSPSCTPDRYEKISCKSAEGYYKQVLYLRYGITDCCAEDANKWFIKKELIDMDAIRDPDYICTIVNPCCPSSSSCNCGTSKTTCNSQ